MKYYFMCAIQLCSLLVQISQCEIIPVASHCTTINSRCVVCKQGQILIINKCYKVDLTSAVKSNSSTQNNPNIALDQKGCINFSPADPTYCIQCISQQQLIYGQCYKHLCLNYSDTLHKCLDDVVKNETYQNIPIQNTSQINASEKQNPSLQGHHLLNETQGVAVVLANEGQMHIINHDDATPLTLGNIIITNADLQITENNIKNCTENQKASNP